METIDEELKRFVIYCKEKRLPKAVISGIPYVGPIFEELIYGDDLDNLIIHVHKETLDNQNAILAAISELMDSKVEVQAPVHVFGGANAEHIILPHGDMAIGTKCNSESKEVFGGGGLNYSARLMTMGVDTVPFLSLGEDRIGRNIQEYILGIARDYSLGDGLEEFISSDQFCVQKASTSHATIIVQDSQRTIFSQRVKEPHYYRDHLKENLKLASSLGLSEASGVIIGHLQCNESEDSSSSDMQWIEALIDRYAGKVPIMINFGSSQLNRGFTYWEDKIVGDIIYQFNLSEAKLFFKDLLGEDPSLNEILHFLRENSITGIITLDRFGAVANYQNGRNGVILAWPLLDVTQITDPTGAGDAFAAGMMAHLKGIKATSFADFFSAVENGRNWAAYACTTHGGSSDCPNPAKLEKFLNTYDFKGRQLVEFLNKESADQIVNLIDMACR